MWGKLRRRLPATTWGKVQLASVATLTGILVMILTMVILWKSKPAYWHHNKKLLASDNATLQQLASTLEQQMLRDLSGSPENISTTRTLRLSFDQANAWLNVKLEDYLANRDLKLPREIRNIMLAGDEGVLILAFEYHNGTINQVLSFEIQPSFAPDGRQFQLKLLRAKAGALPLPIKTLRNQIARQSPQAGGQIDGILATLNGRWLESVQFHPGDARQNLRLTGIGITPEGLNLTLRSEPRPARETTTPGTTPGTNPPDSQTSPDASSKPAGP